MVCQICGKKPGFFPLCKKCNSLKEKNKNIIDDKTNPIYHPDVNKPYYHDSIFFNGKYYHGSIKGGIAELCNDPINPCRLSMLVKVKTKKIKTIHDGGD